MRLVILILGTIQITLSTCPCAVHHSSADVVLSCYPHSIDNFPGDLSDCSFDYKEIDSIELFLQPLYHLGSRAFADFVNLKELGIAYCHNLGSFSTGVFEYALLANSKPRTTIPKSFFIA